MVEEEPPVEEPPVEEPPVEEPPEEVKEEEKEPSEEEEEEVPVKLSAALQVRYARSQREVISVHVGGAGCNLGGALWELFCIEHGIDADGRQTKAQKGMEKTFSIQKNFFHTSKETGRLQPRSVFIDTEPSSYLDPERLIDGMRSPIDRIRTGRFRNLFHKEQLVSFNSSALTYGAGYHSEDIEFAMEAIRK